MKIIHIVYIYIPSPYPLQQELELLQEEGCKAFFEDGGRGLQETHRAAITAKLSLLRGIFLNPPHTHRLLHLKVDRHQTSTTTPTKQSMQSLYIYIHTYLSNFDQIHLHPVLKQMYDFHIHTDIFINPSYL